MQKTKIMASSPITSWQIDGVNSDRFHFLGLQKSLWTVTVAIKLKEAFAPWKKSYDKPRQGIKKQRYHFGDEVPYNQNYGFSSSHVQM